MIHDHQWYTVFWVWISRQNGLKAKTVIIHDHQCYTVFWVWISRQNGLEAKKANHSWTSMVYCILTLNSRQNGLEAKTANHSWSSMVYCILSLNFPPKWSQSENSKWFMIINGILYFEFEFPAKMVSKRKKQIIHDHHSYTVIQIQISRPNWSRSKNTQQSWST